jgi:RNA polymerase sigma factor (sigma-70 family)
MTSVAVLIVKLRKLLRHKGRSPEDTDDLIQDAFLRLEVYRRERVVQEPEAFLVRTVQNLSIDLLRKSAHRLHVGVETQEARLIDPRPPPDEVLTGQQRLQQLRRGLESLAPRTREAVLLHRIEGYSHAQIAAHLGISISAVEKHIAKAALFLSDFLAGEEP